MSAHPDSPASRLLIFVVAYDAEKTIAGTLDRIPPELHRDGVEVLVIDDSSKDETFARGVDYEEGHPSFKVHVLRTPENQGYGGNQKLGYRYAIEHGFDAVALLHGDGQYAPERLSDLATPVLRGEADAVFGSRMLDKKSALRGGMPLYKWVGNQILSRFQNALLGTSLSEFHSGYRVYSTAALRRIPFERNTDDFHFDTEIIIQLVLAGLRITEIPIPTYYGDEICHVNGLRYAKDVCMAVIRARIHGLNLLYDRRYDLGPEEEKYDLKLGYTSSHTMAIDAVAPGQRVLDVGCGQGWLAAELARKGCRVTGLDRLVPAHSPDPEKIELLEWDLDRRGLPVDPSAYDVILMLDIIEHLRSPELFLDDLREAARSRRPEIIFTTGNVAFFVTRAMLALGKFNYGRKGILDRTHTRLFTFDSMRALLGQCGYRVLETKGVPAPFPAALGDGPLARFLLALNRFALRVLPGLFSYQIFVRARLRPTVATLLEETHRTSEKLREVRAATGKP